MLKYKCPSTGREYVKFVEPKYESADLAQAESHKFSLLDYQQLQAET